MTRTVVLVGRWALKFPGGIKRSRRMFWCFPVRGWLANRSEWRQRWRPDVARPRLTIGHLVLVMPRADRVAEDDDEWPWRAVYFDELNGEWEPTSDLDSTGDERKPSSWGLFGDRWRLVDFDRAWRPEDRGLVGWFYYGRQERLARKWMALP